MASGDTTRTDQNTRKSQDPGLPSGDWRLPNVRELQSIVDYGRVNPAIDPVFGALSSVWYFSSTPYEDSPADAWSVRFNLGDVRKDVKVSLNSVRAVRSGP